MKKGRDKRRRKNLIKETTMREGEKEPMKGGGKKGAKKNN